MTRMTFAASLIAASLAFAGTALAAPPADSEKVSPEVAAAVDDINAGYVVDLSEEARIARAEARAERTRRSAGSFEERLAAKRALAAKSGKIR